MLFNTVSYIAFLAIVVSAYWTLRERRRTWLILIASLVFYAMWRVEFVFLIAFSALVDWYFALRIFHENKRQKRRLWLLCSLGINLGLLAYFKYAHFLLDNVAAVGTLLGRQWAIKVGEIVLPLGISFYTFLSISYTLDVYRGLFIPVRNFWVYLTYVTFWPHMIAGPILRAHELIPQIVEIHKFNNESFADGIRKILFGLFLKVALADQIAPYVDEAFLATPAQLSALDVWTMAFAFGLQIYFDFGGYSLIAIGSAQILGIHFPANFRWPYLATSPREFWQRWHITLSSWIRDYLYLPLCGLRFLDRSSGGLEVNLVKPSSVRSSLALFLTWFLMGLWHGAAWRFALWGIWHATFIWIYRTVAPNLNSIPFRVRAVAGWAVTVAVTMLSWIPFRAQTLSGAVSLLARILDVHAYTRLTFQENFYLIIGITFGSMLCLHFLSQNVGMRVRWPYVREAGDVFVMSIVIFIVFLFLRPNGQFIYFQF